jgi:hypothetical protein
MAARRHHYVSQCYLKAFSVQRKKSSPIVNVFDRQSRKVFECGIHKVALEGDFNRVEIEEHEPDAVERAMAEFESQLAPALAHIIEARSLENEEDRSYLLNFIGLLALRNPRQREIVRDFQERVAKTILGIVLATPERWESQVKRAKAAGFIDPNANTNYDAMKQFAEKGYTVEVANERLIRLEFNTFDKILPLIFRRGWVLVKAPEDSGGFVTSDHPFCLTWSEPRVHRRIGLGLKNTEIVFPLSPRLAVVGAFELQDGEHEASADLVAEMNGTIIAFAERQVYARDQNFTYSFEAGEAAHKASRLINDQRFLRPHAAR